jgi:hypothetical protein
MCDIGYVEMLSAKQMAFAEARRADRLQWQKQILEYGKAEWSN